MSDYIRNSGSTYKRIVATAMAEQILSQATINMNIARLRSAVRSPNSDTTVYRFLKKAIEGDGFVTCKWYGRDKRTARIFPRKGELPMTNVSNEAVLDAFDSRYDGGKIVCMDYSNHEWRILRSLFGLDHLPLDLHTHLAELWGIPRDDAKLVNNILLYGTYDDMKKKCRGILDDCVATEEQFKEYYALIHEVRGHIEKFVATEETSFNENGYVFNQYGRKVYPKGTTTIFNNTIQSVGSEVLIDSIIELSKQPRKNPWNILFQRFDSIYFDFSRDALKSDLKSVVATMEGINEGMNLSVNVSVGESVRRLKEIHR